MNKQLSVQIQKIENVDWVLEWSDVEMTGDDEASIDEELD